MASSLPTRRLGLLGLLALLGACATPTELPEGSGRGLVSYDRMPPPGVEVFDQPAWTPGDRFVFRLGEDVRIAFRVDEVAPDGITLLEEESGLRHRLDPQLGDRGQDLPGRPEATVVFDPADSTFSFPLWVGKRWSCHYLSKHAGASEPVPLLVSYHCDAIEEVTVPAGTFRCLRIWRRARVAAKGDYRELCSLFWYAPEAGFVARRLNGNELLELQFVHRQTASGASAPARP